MSNKNFARFVLWLSLVAMFWSIYAIGSTGNPFFLLVLSWFTFMAYDAEDMIFYG